MVSNELLFTLACASILIRRIARNFVRFSIVQCHTCHPGSLLKYQCNSGPLNYISYHAIPMNSIFGVMRRYRTNQSISNTVEPTWLMWPWWVKIPTDDTLLGDNVRCGDWGDGHGGWQGGRWSDQHGSCVGDWHENTYWRLDWRDWWYLQRLC